MAKEHLDVYLDYSWEGYSKLRRATSAKLPSNYILSREIQAKIIDTNHFFQYSPNRNLKFVHCTIEC